MKYIVRYYQSNTGIQYSTFDTLTLAREFAKKECNRDETWADIYEKRSGMYTYRVVKEYKD